MVLAAAKVMGAYGGPGVASLYFRLATNIILIIMTYVLVLSLSLPCKTKTCARVVEFEKAALSKTKPSRFKNSTPPKIARKKRAPILRYKGETVITGLKKSGPAVILAQFYWFLMQNSYICPYF